MNRRKAAGNWTTKNEIAAAAGKLWESGRLPAALISGARLFPRSVKLKGPGAGEMAERLSETREWCDALRAGSKEERRNGYRLEYRHIRHKILGENNIPERAVIDTEEDALALAGKKGEAELLLKMAEETASRLPALLAFLHRKPLRALEAASQWGRLLDICEWMLEHERPSIYLREIEVPGVHTKFIEGCRALLGELLDLLLPESAIDKGHSSGAGFEERYGFRKKAETVRLRLPADCRIFPRSVTDIALTDEEFAVTEIPCREILITENLINFLSLPRAEGRLIIWGAGYGFSALRKAGWIAGEKIIYWGDIDTHGFAILSELRAHYPQARSFLMDEATLLAHRDLCVEEPKPAKQPPENLTEEEKKLFMLLRGKNLRLEQERIGIEWVREALKKSIPAAL
ncbi:MAG: DUF2220 family protein [Synergistaceae bacterium]|nr:DUF2220 family protein [Synergistaceae bacterium]